VLPEIVEAVRGTGVEVYVDGGVRLGTDVLTGPLLWGQELCLLDGR